MGRHGLRTYSAKKGQRSSRLKFRCRPQSGEETIRRQLRYKASGVRGAWFFGVQACRGAATFGRETPAFILQPVVVGKLPTVERFDVSLIEFVQAMLHKRLVWKVPRYSKPHLIEFIEDVCWACKSPVKQILEHLHGGHSADEEALTPEDFYEGRWDPPAYTVASLSNSLEAVQADITNDELAAQGLNLIARRGIINGKPTRFPYCNLCLHCRAPQNNHYVSKRLDAVMQVQNADDGSLEEPANEKQQEPQGFGIAVIPREVEGLGTWILHEQCQPN